MLPAQLQRQASAQDRVPTGSLGPRPTGYTAPPGVDHHTTHENDGSDEINVVGLSGELADAQPPKAHKVSHENGGTDEISVAGLNGELADVQPPKLHGNAAHSSTFATEVYADTTAGVAAVAAVGVHAGLADPHTGYVKHSLATAVSDFLVASGVGAFVKKTLAEVKTILGLGSAAYAATTDFDAAGVAASKIASSISDGDTTHAPDGNSVYDALALKLTGALGSANLKAFMNAAGTAMEWSLGVKVGSFTRSTGTASGNVSYTGVGFKPSAILVMGGIDGVLEKMFGFSTAADGVSLYSDASNANTTSAMLIHFVRQTSVQDAVVASMDSDGFTLTWTATASGGNSIKFSYIAFR